MPKTYLGRHRAAGVFDWSAFTPPHLETREALKMASATVDLRGERSAWHFPRSDFSASSWDSCAIAIHMAFAVQGRYKHDSTSCRYSCGEKCVLF